MHLTFLCSRFLTPAQPSSVPQQSTCHFLDLALAVVGLSLLPGSLRLLSTPTTLTSPHYSPGGSQAVSDCIQPAGACSSAFYCQQLAGTVHLHPHSQSTFLPLKFSLASSTTCSFLNASSSGNHMACRGCTHANHSHSAKSHSAFSFFKVAVITSPLKPHVLLVGPVPDPMLSHRCVVRKTRNRWSACSTQAPSTALQPQQRVGLLHPGIVHCPARITGQTAWLGPSKSHIPRSASNGCCSTQE